MKLLLDQNLSPRLVDLLETRFPGIEHVRFVGLDQASDETVWEFARVNRYAIVSKDQDFHQLAFLRGAPPKVIWLRVGNCTTLAIEQTLLRRAESIEAFFRDKEGAFLVVDAI